MAGLLPRGGVSQHSASGLLPRGGLEQIAAAGGGDTGAIAGWELRIVPAPSALALLGLGGVIAGRRNRR